MSPPSKRPSRPVARDGARSPNRGVATSAEERENPTPARRPVKAGAVAAAEHWRARGERDDLSEATPASDGTALAWAQSGERLTTAQGLAVDDADNSLTAGDPGARRCSRTSTSARTITHFDHERIPERVVHARGAGGARHVRGDRGSRGPVPRPRSCTRAPTTPVFVRFSTVAGSRGSADTARDVRGFATKFYTSEGNFDLVGNNIPVFFIQDGLKFPDLIHAVKPEPDREIPQAQTAHDTFWDFVSLQPESTHMLMWVDVRPGDPAFLRHHGGLRRPHVPPRRRATARPRW